MEATDIRIKRVYEAPTGDDGLRVLVDRLWPRGLSKEKAAVHRWVKDIAPSTALRKWYNHDPERWAEFRRRYKAELAQAPEAVAALRQLTRQGRVTLLFAARDEARNNAVVLRDVLAEE